MMGRILLLLIMSVLLAFGATLPGTAQEPPAFATNTPPPPPLVFSTPAAPINRYALRTWREADLLEMLYTRIRQLTPGAAEQQSAIRLMQHELRQRFPAAPRDPAAHERLLRAMLNAPAGSIDMRTWVRPYIEAALNQQAGSASTELLPFEFAGFQIEVIPADLDGADPQDAVLHIYYPGATQGLIYNDYVPVVAGAGGYRLLSSSALPVAPLGPVSQIEMMGVGDFNQDGLDELAVALDTGALNRELRIFGWRSGSLASLIQPGQTIHYGQIDNWMSEGRPLEVRVYREESAEWRCLAEQTVVWQWRANFFRPTPGPDGYTLQNTANCLFYSEEPIFALPIHEALATINDLLAFVPADDDYSAQRARMIQAMLHAFDGDTGTAMATALDLEAGAAPESWLAQQTGAFIAALGQPGATPLQICAALIEASPHGACQVDDALTRILDERPLQREQPIAAQMAELGITVQEEWIVSEVGHADRQAVRFDLAGEHTWAFAPLDPEFYTAERLDPPTFNSTAPPLLLITTTPAMLDALLVNNDPATVLAVLDGLVRAHPQATLSPEVRFLQALSLDLLADRPRARQAYYDLWQQHPLSGWGQLAAEHLEQR